MKKSRIEIILNPFNRFIRNGSAGGIVLFISAVVAMVWINSPFRQLYYDLWHVPFTISFGNFSISKDLHHWINDGLMAVFFFTVGLELKREFINGELSSFRKALLPMAAAAGGMVVPALIYLAFNTGSDTMNGWGVPMATDIAFALGILMLLGDRVPLAAKVFLTALAIADDLGAVLVIAFFYTSDVSLVNVAIGAAFMAAMLGGNLLGVRTQIFYGLLGIGGLWLAFLLSGIHATIAGVLAAFTIPARSHINKKEFTEGISRLVQEYHAAPSAGGAVVTQEQQHIIEHIKNYSAAAETPLQRLESKLHPLVAFVVMPVFALANAGIELSGDLLSDVFKPVTLGIFLGLVAGKFVGIAGATRLFVVMRLTSLPEGTHWRHIYGLALLGGVGFTMSLFITELAFDNPDYALQAKLGIITASLVSGLAGYLVLRSCRD